MARAMVECRGAIVGRFSCSVSRSPDEAGTARLTGGGSTRGCACTAGGPSTRATDGRVGGSLGGAADPCISGGAGEGARRVEAVSCTGMSCSCCRAGFTVGGGEIRVVLSPRSSSGAAWRTRSTQCAGGPPGTRLAASSGPPTPPALSPTSRSAGGATSSAETSGCESTLAPRVA